MLIGAQRGQGLKVLVPVELDLRPQKLAISPKLQDLQGRVATGPTPVNLFPQLGQLLF